MAPRFGTWKPLPEASQELWLRVAAGGEQDVDRTVGDDGIRIATGLASGASYVDLIPRPNTQYEYRVKVYGNNNTTRWSAWTAAA